MSPTLIVAGGILTITLIGVLGVWISDLIERNLK
jgi:hypothetical protein